MKVAIYNPGLATLGGGEKYTCTIGEILSDKHEVHLLSHCGDISKHTIEERLNVNLGNVKIIVLPKVKTVNNKHKIMGLPRIIKYYKERREIGSDFQRGYDLFINTTLHKPIFCGTKNGILIVQFPLETIADDYSAEKTALKRIAKKLYYDFEWYTRFRSYDTIIVYSEFVKKWLKKAWNVDSIVVWPPAGLDVEDKRLEKKNIILAVGRFFVELHNKKQHIMVSVFKDLCLGGLRDWEFHVIGGVMNKDKDLAYLDGIKREANGFPIYFHVNAPFSEVLGYYEASRIFWHAAGYGEDEEGHPEKMEHFGMTTVEAMSAECVPVVINRGGQPEIVRNKIDGYLWNNEEELKSYTMMLCNNTNLLREMQKCARQRSQLFNKEEFKKKVFMLVNELEKAKQNRS